MTDVQSPSRPSTAARPAGRGTWPWRDYPAVLWLLAAAGLSAAHPFVAHSRWLMVHLVLLGALTHAAMVWSTHFAQALLKTDAAIDPRRRQSLRLALLATGVLLVLVGVAGERWPVTVAGAVVASGAVLWHATMLWRRLRASIAPRFTIAVRYYLVAAGCLPIGATFGALLARGPDDETRARLLVAHTSVMVLGWIGLTVTGTLVTLWPTMLRTRLDERAEGLARQSLPVLAGGLTLAAVAGVTGQRPLAAIGLLGYAAGLAWWARALWQPLRTRPPRELAPLAVGAALVWWLFAVLWFAGSLLLRRDWTEVGDTMGVATAAVAGGFAPQLLLGALGYLVPSVLGGGPAAVRAAQARVDRWAAGRWIAVNSGLTLSLLPVPSAVRVLTTTVVLAAYLAAIVLILLGIRASLRVRRGGDAPPAHPERPGERPSLWSSGQVVAAVSAVSLAVALGVLADPVAAGLVPGAAQAGPAAAASGRTTTVRVVADHMRFTPDHITVPAGDRLVIELVNEDPTTTHDLVLSTGAHTERLPPGGSERLDAGMVGGPLDGWCSVVGHRQLGMVLTVEVTGAAPGATGQPGGLPTTPAGGHTGHDPVATAGATGPVAPLTPHDPVLAPAPSATVHRVTLTVTELEQQVAPGIWQRRWTFNGTAPGPTLRGKVGDAFEITLVNEGSMGHSIDFHAGSLAPDQPMRTIPPGTRLTFRFTATRSGIWMYHCSTMPMSAHIAAGMHGAVIIDPPGLAPVDHEYVLVQSEVYLGPDRSAGHASEVDAARVAAETPDYVVFNGIADQYDSAPLTARVGERVRIWVLAAGPNRGTSFHVVGGQFDTVYAEGRWLLRAAPGQPDAPGGAQVLALAPAQGGFVELTLPEAGHYPLVNHVMVDAERGAHGILQVTP